MNPYGKTAQAAISAVSKLAEVYDAKNPVKLSSLDIAKARELSQPLVAKVLTRLSQAGIVTGSPGPRGGYHLARAPHKITLLDVVREFDRVDENLNCPFGSHWCGKGPQCPLHNDLRRLQEQVLKWFTKTTFACFSKG